MAFIKNNFTPWIKYLRVLLLLLFCFGFIILAGEIFFVVTNSNRPDFFPIGEPQNMTSGLYSSYVHQDNQDHWKMKAKSALMVDFDLDKDPDLYYGWDMSRYFINSNGSYREHTNSGAVSVGGAFGLVAGDIDNNGYPDIVKWRNNIVGMHELMLNRGGHYFDTYEYLNINEFVNMHSNGLLDYDLDGDLDIVTVSASGQHQFHLLENIGLNAEGVPQFEIIFEFSNI